MRPQQHDQQRIAVPSHHHDLAVALDELAADD
jgi:hypothetical protein